MLGTIEYNYNLPGLGGSFSRVMRMANSRKCCADLISCPGLSTTVYYAGIILAILYSRKKNRP